VTNIKQQVKSELAETRKGLMALCKDVTPEEFVWEPRPGMKSVKAQLQECGVMEKLHTHLLRTGEKLNWETAIDWGGDDAEAILSDLAAIRDETNSYIDRCSDDAWTTPVPIPEEWQQWWGMEKAPEALVRWVDRHEYYHYGQIVYNRWMLGHNPYDNTGV